MTIEEVNTMLEVMSFYWTSMSKKIDGPNGEKMAKAWWLSLEDLPFYCVSKGLIDLSKTLRFPPTPADVRDAASRYTYTSFDAKWRLGMLQDGMMSQEEFDRSEKMMRGVRETPVTRTN